MWHEAKDKPNDYKWGWDSLKQRLHVWPNKDGERGRQTHRQEFAKLMGRASKVTQGDALGTAEVVEKDKHAPEHILVFAYYGTAIPSQVMDYFKEHHPGAVVRRGDRKKRRSGYIAYSTTRPATISQVTILRESANLTSTTSTAAAWAQLHLTAPAGARPEASPEPSLASGDSEKATTPSRLSRLRERLPWVRK